jgi:protein TonB
MTTKKKHFLVYLPTIIGGIIVLVISVLIINAISNVEEKPEKKERKIQPITLLKPPPPPPPPPKVEKPPEPEIKEEIKEEVQPKDEPAPPDEPPPGDTNVGDGAKGGIDVGGTRGVPVSGAHGSGGGGDPYAWYGGLIKNDILDVLSEQEELRSKGYTAIIKIWLNTDGSVQRFELAKGSNDAEIDELINRLIGKYRKVSEPVPPGMEQPVKLRITSKL